MFRRFQIAFASLLCCLFLFLPASAHSGGTDSNGGHYNHSTGEYHYHHGYPAHQHINGVCPYTGGTSSNSGYSGSAAQQETQDRINELLDIEKKYAELQESYTAVMSQRDSFDQERRELKKSVTQLEASVNDLQTEIEQIKQERDKAQTKNIWYFWIGIGAIILVIAIADARSSGLKRNFEKASNTISRLEAERKAAEGARDRAYMERDNAVKQRTTALFELNYLAKQWESLESEQQLALQSGQEPTTPTVSDIEVGNLPCREMARVPNDVLLGDDYWPLMVGGRSAIVYVNKSKTRYHKRECRFSAGAAATNVYRLPPECEPCHFCEPIVVQGKPGWLIDYQAFIQKKIENGIPDPDIK